ncbi:hypothetical protein ACTJIL_05485 [Luteimonas sp. 22616]|uniref:hypothetical protein n=1 Tax=Luteimonas sp. 22616 TaxID=3453951 RepID=UPI003F86E235
MLADNWSLQDVSLLLTDGLPTDEAQTLTLTASGHGAASIPAAITAIEGLFDLLTDIVLRDQILVDKDFAYAWDENGTYADLLRGQIVKPYGFLDYRDRFSDTRAVILDRLLITDSLREAQAKNEESYALTRRSHDPWLGQVVWGGAGMIARASAFNIPYAPHPVRRRFFELAGMALSASSATANLTSFVEEQRATVRNAMRGQDRLHSLVISMDPVPVMVIAESSSLSDLIPTALQLRSSFTGLRNWLGAYQVELEKDDFRAIKSQQRLLKSVGQYVTAEVGSSWADLATLKAGLTAMDLSVQAKPMNHLLNRFGVRSTINRLIFQPNGREHLTKLLRFFDHENSKTGVAVNRHFLESRSN